MKSNGNFIRRLVVMTFCVAGRFRETDTNEGGMSGGSSASPAESGGGGIAQTEELVIGLR